eukprot:288243_1
MATAFRNGGLQIPPESDENGLTNELRMRVKRMNSMDENAGVEHKVEEGGDPGVTPSAPTPMKKMLSEALAKKILSDEEGCSDSTDDYSLCDHICDPSEFDNVEWDKICPPRSPRRHASIGMLLKDMGGSILQRRSKTAGGTAKSPPHEKENVSLTVPLSPDSKYLYLGRGAMCVTYLGMYKNEQVVLKTVQRGCKHYSVSVNDIEVEMLLLNSISHENIVSLKGAGFTESIRFLLLEFLPGGCLTQWIHSGIQRPLMKILDNAIGVCSALSYLHDLAIPGRIVIHRDLKPDNLVFTLDGTIKIIDFGLGKVIRRKYRVRSTYYEMTGQTGSMRYMAPEVANTRKYNEKVDVYSLGLILWEMVARTKPFLTLKRKDFYERVVDKHERPTVSLLDCPEQLKLLMKKAWNHDPDTRLSAREMLGSLQAVAEEENQKSFIELNQLKLELTDNALVDELSPERIHSDSYLGNEKTGSYKKHNSVDLSYTQTILAKEKDYVPKFRFSRLRNDLKSKTSSMSTESFPSTSAFDDREDGVDSGVEIA